MDGFYEFLKIVSPIIGAAVGAFSVLLIQPTKELKVKLLRAYKDIQFYQAVEKVHIEMNVEREGKSNQRKVRGVVRNELKHQNSGLSPSQVDRQIDKLEGELKV